MAKSLIYILTILFTMTYTPVKPLNGSLNLGEEGDHNCPPRSAVSLFLLGNLVMKFSKKA